jgi:hypothetical protein
LWATIKVRRGTAGGSLPDNPEELRLRHKRIALAWAFVATKHCNRPWLKHFQIDVYRKLSDHVLGKEVAGLVVLGTDSAVLLKPSWLQVLRYDSEVRKHAYESIRAGVHATITDAIEASCKDVRVLQLHLLNPLTLEGNARSKSFTRAFDQGEDRGEEAASRGSGKGRPKKGSGKGLGNGAKGSGKKGKRGKGQLFNEIPRSGKSICFAYGKKECEGGCEMAHVCQQCLGSHPLCECPNKPRPKGAAGDKSSAE